MDSSESGKGSASEEDLTVEAQVLTTAIASLQQLTGAGRERVLTTLLTFFGVTGGSGSRPASGTSVQGVTSAAPPYQAGSFSEDRSLSPKAFLIDKKPSTDVERMTCLAYYLTHYRNTPEFKTIDLSKLNTEAAQVKLSNPAFAVENAVKSGFLVPTSRGNKMISANGELYVQALPDREAARAAVSHARRRRRSKRQPGAEASE